MTVFHCVGGKVMKLLIFIVARPFFFLKFIYLFF